MIIENGKIFRNSPDAFVLADPSQFSFLLSVIANKHNRANTFLPIVHAGSWLNLPWKYGHNRCFSPDALFVIINELCGAVERVEIKAFCVPRSTGETSSFRFAIIPSFGF